MKEKIKQSAILRIADHHQAANWSGDDGKIKPQTFTLFCPSLIKYP
jgi:hypothetical protein